MKINCFNCGRRCSTQRIIQNNRHCKYYIPRISSIQLAQMINRTERTMFRWSNEKIIEVARYNGYYIHIDTTGIKRKFYGGKLKCNHLNNAQ